MNFNTRCVCCNKVSSKEIETDIGDYSKSEFVVDPINPSAFICKECKEWHEDLMMNYHQKDDPYGWDNAIEFGINISKEKTDDYE